MQGKWILISVIIICLAGLCTQPVMAQNPSSTDTIPLSTAVVDGNAVPWAMLPEVSIYDKWPRRLRKRAKEWTRLRNAVYVTYPYAKAASVILKDVDAHLASIHSKKERKAYLSEKEKELKAQFGPKLEDLSIYQGKVLIRLIYRETGDNCYNLIKEMKGGFSARLWQTVAFFFGSNLKSDYDKQQNADIETIVNEIESDPYYYYRYYNALRGKG